ncbi:zinc finger protein 641 isoform X2 [Cricetulus griseus]|uniref:zinc finger protein 641 isoform X2 n=1 Tax=Cricetulus griseus TaxID=10029 RepID=UPI0004549320|nr:zinc finger protein 641 isoform X2 [Cricetulus griseus]
MLSEQTAALGVGWGPTNVQLDGAESQMERGNQEEGPWRTAPGPLEHLHCDLEEPLALQEKAQSAPWVPAGPQEGTTGDWEMAAALLAAGSQGLVTIKDVSLCFSQEEWRSLDPSQTDFYGEYVMQENCGIVVSLRFPIPKLDMLSQLEGGEEQWVPDHQDLEGRDILKVTYTGDGSEHKGETPELEAEPPRMLSSVSEDTVPWNPGQDQSWESMPRGSRGMHLSPPFLQEDSFSSLLCSTQMDSLLKPHMCPQCGKQFVWGSHLARHQQTHTGERPYSCLKCEKSFGRRHHLIRHQKTHLHDKPSRCSECGKNFRCNSHLASHQRVHSESKSYKGQDIGESPGAQKQQHALPVPKSHVCTECGKSFGRRHHLVRHWLTHTGEKPFHCPRCEKSFGRKHHLDRHLLTHQGQSPGSSWDRGTSVF